ncbi:MAG: hypothetical protein KCHDKBKB_02414 [Elusimicrobia bacterium]|nr:hypothetical protein [Elusimicrobiota bacterium]
MDGSSEHTNAGNLLWCQYTHHRPDISWKGFREMRHNDEEDGIPPNIWLSYNSDGIRGPELISKTKPRLLLLGDSFMHAEIIHFEQTAGQQLQKIVRNSLQVLQHGYHSWAPIVEFAWFHHFGTHLKPERIYLFLLDNDFYPRRAYSKTDPAYRRLMKLDPNGVPLYIPDFQPKIPRIFMRTYLGRTIETRLFDFWSVIKPKIDHLKQLMSEPEPWGNKMKRLYSRIQGNSHLYEPEYAPLPTEKFELLKAFYAPHRFDPQNNYHNEMVFIRMSESAWDPVMQQAVQSTLKSLIDFGKYLGNLGSELVVVYVPLGIDVDARESTGAREKMGLKKGFVFKQVDLEKIVDHELTRHNIRFINLKPKLRQYKNDFAPGEKNFLYYKYDGHWTPEGHIAIAQILKDDLDLHSVKNSSNGR